MKIALLYVVVVTRYPVDCGRLLCVAGCTNGLQAEKLVEFVGNRRVEITKVGIVARY